MTKTVLISGAGIAGPALALWLARHGFEPTVIEQASGLRDGGYAVDFRGHVHMGLLQHMGVLDEIRRQQTNMGAMSYVDARGRTRSSLPADFMAGDVEILRGDLGQILHDATRADTDYIFGDSVTALNQDDDGVDVRFAQGDPRRFDLVVGADGLHSKVRSLAFGCGAAEALHEFGYHIAIFTIPNLLGLDRTGRFYNEPGLSAGLYAARNNTEAKAVLSFATPDLEPRRRSRAEQEAILHERFAGMGWETGRLLDAMPAAPDLYFDSLSQVRLPRWSVVASACWATPATAPRPGPGRAPAWPSSAPTSWPAS